jgi:hypothetical protein
LTRPPESKDPSAQEGEPAEPVLSTDLVEPLAPRALVDASRARLVRAARRAVALVRIYRTEEGPGGTREQECLAEVARVRALLSERRGTALPRAVGPGIAKAPSEPEAVELPEPIPKSG